MKKVHIIIIALLLIQCSLIGPSRNINDIRDWVDAKIGDKRTYEYIIRWFDPNDHDILIDSIFGEMEIIFDSIVYKNNYVSDSINIYYYVTKTISYYDSSGFIGKEAYIYTYYLDSDRYIFNYNNYLLLAPVEIGQYWHDDYTGVNRRISEINVTRETEAGIFHDVIIMTESFCADTIGEVWYSPMVGDIIKHIDYGNQYFTSTYNYELVKFERE